MDCIFCRIVAGEIPASIVHRDEHTVAFHDLDPRAPVHVLVIPSDHVSSLNDVDEAWRERMGSLFVTAARVADELGIAGGGYRVVMNTGRAAGQSVDHVHLHVLGGRSLSWPPG